MQKPRLVSHFRHRAASFYAAARDLTELNTVEDPYSAAIGLLAIHGCIAMADALLVSSEGQRGSADHSEAARRLRSWCSAHGLEARGIKHFEWLLAKKSLFAYEEHPVSLDTLHDAKIRMDQFFAWALQMFPGVAQLAEVPNA